MRYISHAKHLSVLPPEPLPTLPVHREQDVFTEQDYTRGGLYETKTLSALHDFLLAPMLGEAVTYKLAGQVINLHPDNRQALTPMDVFPAGTVD